jgi:molybdate transport system ATP-binding protein
MAKNSLMIQLTNLFVIKNDFEILKDLNLEIFQGQNWLVVGESGSGKSTLLDVLASKVFPTRGKFEKKTEIKIVAVGRDYSFHKIVGNAYQYYQQRYNSQDAEIGPTVRETLQNQVLPIGTIDIESVEINPPKYDTKWLIEIAEKMQIDHLLDRKITSLSNGETRRTLIAYALLKKPDVILLDNPFTGLDIESRSKLKLILGNLKKTNVVLVANPADFPQNFENIILMEDGKLKYEGLLSRFSANDYIQKKEIKIPESIFDFHKTTENFTHAIRLMDGKVKYGEKTVLDQINWEVKKGEKWALTGPNGSGKSSLLSLINADNPQGYQNQLFLFDQKRGTGESIWELKQKIGFVSPELQQYFNKQTLVWKVVASGFFDAAGLFRKISEEQTNLVNLYLNLMGIDHLKERPLQHLSNGQQRLVFLARALVKNPPLLILDEPCQGLDYNQMVFFRELLNEISILLEKTLIFVTHYEDEIPSCVNKRLRLDNGKVIYNGDYFSQA